MTETLDDLTDSVRTTLPQPSAIKNLKSDPSGHFISFQWNGREFVIRKNFEVFELRNRQLMMTAASVLMQTALSSKTKHQKILEAAVGALYQVEEMIGDKHRMENGMKLLGTVKSSISKLCV